jgi:hypothetical protein
MPDRPLSSRQLTSVPGACARAGECRDASFKFLLAYRQTITLGTQRLPLRDLTPAFPSSFPFLSPLPVLQLSGF